jgi:hypothetical protein
MSYVVYPETILKEVVPHLLVGDLALELALPTRHQAGPEAV